MKNFRKLTACLLAVLMIVSVFPVSVFAQTVTPKDVLRDDSDENLAIIVTFDPNGGSCDVETAEVNAEGCLDELPQPVWLGHDFLGWFTEAEGGEEVTLETVFNESATVYAQWTGDEGSDDSDENLPIIITFDANGGETAGSPRWTAARRSPSTPSLPNPSPSMPIGRITRPPLRICRSSSPSTPTAASARSSPPRP